MNHDDAVRVLLTEFGDLLRREALVNRTKSVPQHDASVVQRAHGTEPWCPGGHSVRRNTHGKAGVSPQVLVGEEQHRALWPGSLKGPIQHALGVG